MQNRRLQLLLVPVVGRYLTMATSATMLSALSAMTMLPLRVVIMLQTTPPPPGIAQV
jgi:hypothetical protein